MTHQTMSVFAILALASAAVLLPPLEANGQSLIDYTAYPEFLASTSGEVPPNILILLDNSQTMNKKAYQDAFDPNKTYVGLFNPKRCYQVDANAVFNYESSDKASVSATCTGTYKWDGNLLNWATMRRIDVVKKVLVGGKCSSSRNSIPPFHECAGGYLEGQGQSQSMFGDFLNFTQFISQADLQGRVLNPPDESNIYFHVVGTHSSLRGRFCLSGDQSQPFDNGSCIAGGGGTLHEIRIQPPADPAEDGGVIQGIGQQARFGLMEYNDPLFTGPADGGRVLEHVDWKLAGDLGPLIDQVAQAIPQAEAQMAESLYEAARYYAQIAPEYDVGDYVTGDITRDPYWFTTNWINPAQYVPCCKAFVLLLTDGEPTQDQNIPVALRDYAHAVHGAHCSGATPTDPCTPHKTNYATGGTHYLDDVALWAHTTDLRQATIPVISATGSDLAGEQNLTLYTVFAFGSGSDLLKEASKAGGFNDSNGNDLPDLDSEWDQYTNATGALGADGIPDTYYEAAEGTELEDRLLAAITSILKQSASGTDVSVVALSSRGEGALYQSFFFPSGFEGADELTWLGYTQAYFMDAFGNVREDTDGDGKLIYANDKIVQTRYDDTLKEAVADRFDDVSPADGQADSTTPVSTVALRDVAALWEAGKRLALTDASSRTLLTWVD
ncbi:hypothetical protein MYX04_13560, partial [Nitrospiraceae bacterium AH_259_D15_M11_P09]|nr:hypothetical protein [Nitrospiraceae bacterium AH_259_D15_M11_P09]